MFIYIEYKGNIYKVSILDTESYETAYERAWWIALKEPKNIEEYKKCVEESFKWSFENNYGVKY
jgi:hypothetical protein